MSSPLTIKILPCDEYGNFAYKGKQRKRKNVVITLDPELLEKAHKLGLNISKVCEKALIQAVKALEQQVPVWCGGLGFEPCTSCRRHPLATFFS